MRAWSEIADCVFSTLLDHAHNFTFYLAGEEAKSI
jgi:hypothetical protein